MQTQTATPNLHAPHFNDAEFRAFADAHPDSRIERTTEGKLIILPPAGMESDFQNTEVVGDLRAWAKRDGRGKVFGPSLGCTLPDGSILSPDAAWISTARLNSLTPKQRRDFVPFAPEFVIEVLSPSDRISAARAKMNQWIANGAELAWLIDPRSQSVEVFRRGTEPRRHTGIDSISGEGPITGFTLDLAEIWAGL